MSQTPYSTPINIYGCAFGPRDDHDAAGLGSSAALELRDDNVVCLIRMASLQQQIADKFLAALAESGDIDAEKIDQLRQLLTRGKTPKSLPEKKLSDLRLL